LTQLFASPAGYWPKTGANANIVPVVANGKVYVAACRSLTIFGILPASARAAPEIALQPSPIVSSESPHVITGTLLAVNGSTLTLQTLTGKNVKIDASQAMKNQRVGAPLSEGMALTVQGSSIEGSGALLATSMYRAKGSSGGFWPPDRWNPFVPLMLRQRGLQSIDLIHRVVEDFREKMVERGLHWCRRYSCPAAADKALALSLNRRRRMLEIGLETGTPSALRHKSVVYRNCVVVPSGRYQVVAPLWLFAS
jgi:hypothetical protein